VLVNTGTALFAGLVPIPGGMGVAEGALTAGLIAVGVDETTAFTAAITHRMLTYYLPPIWGWVAFRGLVRNGYL
jgi:glycosyltransferase 2 family protein